MTLVPRTIHLPADPWHAVQALAHHEGNPTTVILPAVGEYVTAQATRLDARTIVRGRSGVIPRPWTHGLR
jgi:hypothetical protein